MILFCRYGIDPTHPDLGIVVASYDDGVASPIAPPNTILVPYSDALETLGKFGPEPSLMGDPPLDTATQDNRRRAEDFRPWAAPPITPTLLKGYLANQRYEREIAGITVDGISVATDRNSQDAVEKLASRATRKPDYKTIFTGSNGSEREIDATTVLAIADQVADHVDGLRSRAATIVTEIEAGKVTTFAAIDKALDA